MYSVGAYGEMIGDRVRTRAYEQALRKAVAPGSVVVDIGTGTGIFAMLAVRFGARQVYAIEPSDAIQVARDIAAANGCADRIRFIQGVSTGVSLPERADVIVSDLRGVTPLYQRHLPAVVDARERLLAPGGTLIPRQDRLLVAAVDSARLYDRLTAPWGADTHGLDMEPARRILTNRWDRVRVDPDQILLPAQAWTTLDYTRVADADVRGELAWVADRSGTAHGLLLWFDAILADGVEFSNAPWEPESIYGSAFFPLARPVALDAGDRIAVSLSADLVGADYVWRWDTDVAAADEPQRIKATYRQSTFYGTPLSAAQWRKTAASHVPVLDEDGEIDRFVLSRIDGRNSLAAIARELADRFPDRYANWKLALARVGELSKAYSRRVGDGGGDPHR